MKGSFNIKYIFCDGTGIIDSLALLETIILHTSIRVKSNVKKVKNSIKI